MNILASIVEYKREEVALRKRSVRPSALRESEFFEKKPLPFASSLEHARPFAVIAEIKRSSPSAGRLAAGVVPEALARSYQTHGAAAISVLTDERFFSGSLQDLRTVRPAVDLPLLRKDFIVDEFQIFEAKACGADAVLLLASILEKSQIAEFNAAAIELGMESLVELYEESEFDKLDFDRMKLVGINNRDLRTFAVDIGTTIRLARLVPNGVTLVSESGIRSVEEIRRLKSAGVRAALIGEHFMKAADPGKALEELLRGLDDGASD